MGLKAESERRGQQRVDITQDIVVKELGSDAELGKLANIHNDGMMLIGPLGIEDGSVYNVALVLSSTGDVVTSLTVESLWYSETGTGEQYWVGFQVLAVSEDCCESFESLVSKFEP